MNRPFRWRTPPVLMFGWALLMAACESTTDCPSFDAGTARKGNASDGGAGAPRGDGSTGGGATDADQIDGNQTDGDQTDGAAIDGGMPVESLCVAPGDLHPGDVMGTLIVGGAQRTYTLHVPQSYTGTVPVALVLDFHGYGGTGAGEMASSGYRQQSETDDFVVAYPDAVGGSWNVGVSGLSGAGDDLGFARALVGEVLGRGCVDAKRVYATGFSQGGGMAYLLACNAADLFAAVTPSSYDLGIACAPSRPISVLSFRSTDDAYDGNGPLIGAVKTLAKWKQLDGCTGATTDWNGCQVYSTCSAGTEAGLCTVQNGGHTPGSAQTGWAFLSRHVLP